MRRADDGAAHRIGVGPRGTVAAGALLGLLGVAEALVRAAATGAGPQYGVVLPLLALGSTLPLALPRPARAAVTVTLVCVLSLALFHTLTAAGAVAELLALHRLTLTGPTYRHPDLLPAALALPFPVLALAGPRATSSEAAFLAVLLAALAPAAACAGAVRRARGEASLHSAARQAVAGTLTAHTAQIERARIARELHDVVAHHISMVAVQAETARLTTPGMPAAGAQRLSAIGDTARAALTEMRRLLGVLREETGADPADRQPQPGLGQLADLLDQARDASGTGTRLILRGAPLALDPGVELAAYRIVQEALTNARRHAPGAAVDVELHYAEDVLRVRIRDNGPGPDGATAPGGHGLLGMRERAASVGGTLRTGRAPGAGFLVEAELPADTDPSQRSPS